MKLLNRLGHEPGCLHIFWIVSNGALEEKFRPFDIRLGKVSFCLLDQMALPHRFIPSVSHITAPKDEKGCDHNGQQNCAQALVSHKT